MEEGEAVEGGDGGKLVGGLGVVAEYLRGVSSSRVKEARGRRGECWVLGVGSVLRYSIISWWVESDVEMSLWCIAYW